ncbi:MAG: nucleotidyltransferase family protein [Chitinophagaceae bacterium]
MMSTEIIILAGGLGTRIQPLLGNTPKCMAPIGEHPFLHYLIRFFQRQGIQKFIFSLGHGHAEIEAYLSSCKETLDYVICKEEMPLGTGGAVLNALQLTSLPSVWVANGDSYLAANIDPMASFFDMCGAECAIALTEVEDCSRYGTVQLATDYRVTGFAEKGNPGRGWINAGIYLLNKRLFTGRPWPACFSFEQDYLNAYSSLARFFGYRYRNYFVDIGVPEDLQKAQNELIQYAI